MQTITSLKTKRQAIVSDNGNGFHVTFWINADQVSYSKPSKLYKTEKAAVKAAQTWVETGK